jgi:hypothetical protein
MSYLGNNNLPWDISRSSPIPTDAERFSGNSSTTTFTLTRSVNFPTDLEVFVENIQQEPTGAYSVNGKSLVFTEAPPTGTNNVYVVYRNYQSGAQVSLPDGSITYSKLANNIRVFTTDNYTANGNVSSYGLSEPPADANTVFVTVDGVVQRAPAHYTTSGTTITFTSAPPLNANVHIRHLGFRTTSTVTALPANSNISQPTIIGTLTTAAIVPSANATSNIGSPTATYNNIYGTHVGAINAPNDFGFKNRIINGAMVIDQRNAGASITPTTDGVYSIDRWRCGLSVTSKFSVQQNAGSVTPPTGFTNYLGVTSLSAYTVGTSENFRIQQSIEGFNTADLAWGTANAQTVTLSFWVRSSLTGTFGGAIKNSAETRVYPFTYTINSSNTWEYKTIIIPGDTTGTWVGATNGIGLSVHFNLGTGATLSGTAGAWQGGNLFSATGATSVVGTNGATFYITGVQLEKGSIATAFDYRPYGTEYVLCQRYYQNLGNVGCVAYSTQGVTLPVIWPVEFRATPSVSISYSGTANRLYRFTSGGTADITPTIFATNKTITNLYYLSGSWAVGLGEGWATAIVGSAEL